MCTRLLCGFVLGAIFSLAQDSPSKGVHPRATPEDYAVKKSGGNATYAASLIPADLAKHLFAFDITGKYLVFEVACFPKAGKSLQIDPDDFLLKRDKGEMTHVAQASAVALAIQMENLPRRGSRNSEIQTGAHVGYESGIDPVTGRRVSGVYGGGDVGVERGGGYPQPPDYPRPGGSYEDRNVLETQLRDRQLPAGKFDRPVAGYLYFPKAAVKKDGGNYLLEHLGEANAAGVSEKVEMQIPAKNR